MGTVTEKLAAPTASFGEALRFALSRAGVSQEELARRIDRSPASISQWLRGRYIPANEIILAVEDALELRRGTLLRHAVIIDEESELSPEADFMRVLLRFAITERDREMVWDVLRSLIEVRAEARDSERDTPPL